jgi:CheY-like chemotaxis protein
VPDIIILDLMMPELSGFDFLDLLRDRYKLKIPVVIVTAKDLSEREMERLRADTLAVFSKSRNRKEDFIGFLNGYFKRRIASGQSLVQNWRDKLGDEELGSILDEALKVLPERVKALEDAIRQGDAKGIEAVSHGIKGFSGNMGMAEVYELTKAINDELHNSDWNRDKVERLYVELKEIVDELPNIQQAIGRDMQHFAAEKDALQILVAEDDAVNQRLMQTYFKRIGRDCDIVANGVDALDMMRRKDYDIVFMDIQMPVMGGDEAVAAIRKDSNLKDTYVVALTAHAIKGDAEKYIGAGFNDYISKPVKLEAIAETIRKATVNRKSQR